MPTVSHYLDSRHLKSLDAYSYSSVDKSPISRYIMRHWWTYSASFAPSWLAPNLITLLGFSAILLNVISIALFVPDLVGPAGSWLYWSCAFGLFFYQTMDNIDGKQARKTGTSSPLGELFDHGIDTLNCPLGGLVQAMAMGMGHSTYTFFCLLIPCLTMYLSTWEEYHTGTLYLGYFNGPVEGILCAVGVLVVSAIKGPEWWSTRLVELNIPVISPLSTPSAQIKDLMMLFVLAAFLVAHLPLWQVLIIPFANLAPLLAPRTTPGQAYLQLTPVVGFCLLSSLWVFSPNSVMLTGHHLIEFAFLICFLYGQLSSKIILAQLTKGVFPFSPTLLLPLAGGALLVNLPFLRLPTNIELWYLHSVLILSLVSYSVSAHRVIDSFCDYLGINCLTIPTPEEAKWEGWAMYGYITSKSGVFGCQLDDGDTQWFWMDPSKAGQKIYL
ncbi:ethanolaminephosphotransferase [Pseudohyphozyma bogoriensis]|nr:ethanolaminephosphotransferase [Pseudohyphozyma bogoriensis]